MARNIHDILTDLIFALSTNGTLTHDEAVAIMSKPKTRKEKGYSENFEELWKAYPSRLTDSGTFVKVGKSAAHSQYLRIHNTIDHGVLLELVRSYAHIHSDGRYVKDMERWFKSKPWEDVTVDQEQKPVVYRTWDDE